MTIPRLFPSPEEISSFVLQVLGKDTDAALVSKGSPRERAGGSVIKDRSMAGAGHGGRRVALKFEWDQWKAKSQRGKARG